MPGDNHLVTENFLRLNFLPKAGITPGSNDIVAMSCDQILSRYNVSITGQTSTGNRCPGQNQLGSSRTKAWRAVYPYCIQDSEVRPSPLDTQYIYTSSETYPQFNSRWDAYGGLYEHNRYEMSLGYQLCQCASWAVGDIVYVGTGTDCTKLPDGWFFMDPNGYPENTDLYEVIGGVIISISWVT